jgi:hypothetical protein
MATQANHARAIVNGYEVTTDTQEIVYEHGYTDNKVGGQNTGFEAHQRGAFAPKLTWNGYAKRGAAGLITAANLLSPSGVGSTNDTEYIISMPLGNAAAPAVGDVGVMFDGTLLSYKRPNPLTALQNFQSSFSARGKRNPPFPIHLYDNAAIKTATNFSTTPYDDGTDANAGTTLGGVAQFQCYSPTGVAATGNIGVPTQPVANDTVVVNGTTYTWVSSLTPTVGQVLIGATALASAQNLFAALTGGLGSGTTYAAGTTSFSQNLIGTNAATVFFSTPAGVNNTITITYATTGTAGNGFTLTKTGTGGLTVSGATLTGGTAGDTYNIVLASATTSGGAYTTLVTWSGVGAVRQAIRTEIAIGTTINEWLKLTITLASGAGTSQTFSGNFMVGRFWQL